MNLICLGFLSDLANSFAGRIIYAKSDNLNKLINVFRRSKKAGTANQRFTPQFRADKNRALKARSGLRLHTSKHAKMMRPPSAAMARLVVSSSSNKDQQHAKAGAHEVGRHGRHELHTLDTSPRANNNAP